MRNSDDISSEARKLIAKIAVDNKHEIKRLTKIVNDLFSHIPELEQSSLAADFTKAVSLLEEQNQKLLSARTNADVHKVTQQAFNEKDKLFEKIRYTTEVIRATVNQIQKKNPGIRIDL